MQLKAIKSESEAWINVCYHDRVMQRSELNKEVLNTPSGRLDTKIIHLDTGENTYTFSKPRVSLNMDFALLVLLHNNLTRLKNDSLFIIP